MIFDLVIVAMLAVAVVSGLWTIHQKHNFFRDFHGSDLLAGRVDAVLYLAVVCSTALCLIDAVFRVQWIIEIGWSNAGLSWAIRWLAIHAGFAISATVFHIVTNRLLSNSEICELCRRRFD